MASGFQKDFKLTQVSNAVIVQKVTLALGPSGDVQLVEGRDKLAEQLMRAVVNDQTMSSGLGLNSIDTSARSLKTLFTLILRNFRQSQIYQTQASDPRVIGFNIYRFDRFLTSSTFMKASDHPVTWKFSDINLQNGFTYTYGVTKQYSTGFESALLEQVDVTPTQFQDNQNPVVGKNLVLVPGDKSVTAYVDYNRTFKYAELLESIEEIQILQDNAEPRKYIANITITSLDDNQLSMSSSRVNLNKG